MADGARKLLNIIKQTNTDTASNIVSLTVVNTDPLLLAASDKLLLSEEFLLFANYIDKSLIKKDDKFRAISLNYGQLYYIIEIIESDEQLDKYLQRIEALEGN